jgi:HSP20 family molecular chaperone IbpA
MATSKPAPSSDVSVKTPRICGEAERQDFSQTLQRHVSDRAYHLFESSGCEHGNDHAHWLQAEREILQRGFEIRESGSWLSINAHLPDVSADDIQVYLEPTRVIVRAEKTKMTQNPDSQEQGLTQRELFLVEDLNTEIDPSTASAVFRDQKLTLMVKKHFPETSTLSPRDAAAQS